MTQTVSPLPARADEPKTPDGVIDTIASCLHDGHEVFMSRDLGAQCVVRGRGSRLAQQSGMPYAIGDTAAACADETDQRRLYGDIIKRILQTSVQKSQPIAQTGIRIIGALFCAETDIVGVDLPYSLVLDYSAFTGRVFGRNIQLRGDLSIDGSFLPRGLILTRSRVNGSIYAENSFVGRVAVFDSQIQGSWHQTNGIILGSAEFRGLTLSGDLGLAETALSMVSVLSAQVAGGIVLNNSEARCAYHIRGSNLGYFFGENVGFGEMTPVQRIGEGLASDSTKLVLPWWSRLPAKPARPGDTAYTNIGLRMASPAVRGALEREIKAVEQITPSDLLRGCEHMSHSENAEFYFLNNRVQTTVCLRSFGWLRPENYKAQRTTILSLNGTNVAGNLIIDLWGKLSEAQQEVQIHPDTRILEAIGISTGALIFDFSDNPRRYVTYLDGLKFNQVHTATVNCEFRRDQEGSATSGSAGPNGGILQQPSLPTVQDVMRWLEKNGSRSSQPFTAFVEAFDHAGADASELRIAHKTADLCESTPRWLAFLLCQDRPVRRQKVLAPLPLPLQEAGVVGEVYRGIVAIPAFMTLGFKWTLYGLADHGIRPGKVVWWVIGVLVLFFLIFWYVLKIVGFEPKNKPAPVAGAGPWPLSVLFLFDRLLPLYKIREEHYAIERFFRRATAHELASAPQGPSQTPFEMRYLGWPIMVTPASELERKQAERWLLVLRVIGLVLTVFLLAAINALTR